MEKYIKIENSLQELKVSVDYDLGGYSYATGREKARGYYVSVQPVERDGMFEKMKGYTGVRKLLVEVSRKSNKKYEEACTMVNDTLIEQLKSQCKIEYIDDNIA